MNKKSVLKELKSEITNLGNKIDDMNKVYDHMIFKYYLISKCSEGMRGKSLYDDIMKLTEDVDSRESIILMIPRLTDDESIKLYNEYDMYREFNDNNEIIPFNMLVFTRICNSFRLSLKFETVTDKLTEVTISKIK